MVHRSTLLAYFFEGLGQHAFGPSAHAAVVWPPLNLAADRAAEVFRDHEARLVHHRVGALVGDGAQHLLRPVPARIKLDAAQVACLDAIGLGNAARSTVFLLQRMQAVALFARRRLRVAEGAQDPAKAAAVRLAIRVRKGLGVALVDAQLARASGAPRLLGVA